MIDRRCLLVLIFIVVASHLQQFSVGQVPVVTEPSGGHLANSPRVLVELSEVASVRVAAADIEQIRRAATDTEQLPDEMRAEIIELCDKSNAKLTEAGILAEKTSLLQKELDEAGSALETLQSKAINAEPAPIQISQVSADEMRSRLSAADQQVSATRERAQQVAAEIERRTVRRKALPLDLAQCRERLGKTEETLKHPAKKDENPVLAAARRLYQTARREYFEKMLQSLEQEARTYEATSRLWLARRDVAEKQLQQAIDSHKVIHDLAGEAQRHEAERQARKARRAAVNAHPSVKAAAARNAELAEQNQALVRRKQKKQVILTEARELAQTMQHRLVDVTKRSEAVKNSPAIGVMMRSQQDQLPQLGQYRDRLRIRPLEISQLRLDIYEWELQRREALHVDKAIELALQQIELTGAGSMREDIASELKTVLETRAGILAEVISNANDCVSRLEELDAAENEVVGTTEQLKSFIDEHVLWVQSAPILSLDEFRHVRTLWDDFDNQARHAQEIGAAFVMDARHQSDWWGFAAVLIVILFLGRGRARHVLRRGGDTAVKPTATLFRPTVEASLATIFLASPVPAIIGFIGWRLCQPGKDLPNAIGWAILLYAAAFAMLDLVRHASRLGGLGTNHFGWDQKALAAIRRTARSLQWLALPPLAVAVGVEIAHNEATVNSIGRLSLIFSLLVISVVCFRLFRPTGALVSALTSSATGPWAVRSLRIIAPVTSLAVLGVITASSVGYHYTAMQLTRRVFVSCLFVFACLALRSLLMRWLLVAYRRVAMQRAREKRQAMLEAQENASAENPVIEVESHLSLSDINQQARKLVGVGAGMTFLASMWLVWGDVLPALGIFHRVELWASGLVSADPDAILTYVTLADLFLAVGIFALTLFAGRNLPGLLEIAVLQKLPFDAGARYAASSMTRYAIMVVGVALGMQQLGIGWNSVQWLVAAMTVGLGFGLQEIFANFVSGIILLFERPARVGDTVTVGDVTGTITKIRIRATTILDWDNKELIVPNKEFVTGNLVNWTLTNANLRLVVKVGIAYGSDARLATDLLYKVARENPNVLKEPEAVVVFNEFGDSSLNFELRMFVSDLTMYRRLRHDLHLAIDDLFKQHDIVIAFPQCDLHVRTFPDALRSTLSTSQSMEGPGHQDVAA